MFALADAVKKGYSIRSVLPAPSEFVPLDSITAPQVAAILDELRKGNDYVVVDLPRALVNWIEPVVDRADELIVVTDITVPSIRHCRRLVDFFTQDHLALPVEIVVNHQRKPLMTSSLQKEAAKALDRPLGHWLPDDPKAAGAAAGRGKPLSVVAPRSPLARSVSKLATDIRISLGAPAQLAAR